MKPTKEQKSLNPQKSNEQQLEEKQLTLEELASVAGGAGARVNDIKGEDSKKNKVEIT
ncbi:hypothetical protein [Cystobacter ferrugineus]|uniref:hypothetical protein n=1 Tax=Cystobacter ferrugineus TaxID=83449 RepID=UPI000B319F59|nr:hypothetical protein [Cystobacter ferrugineus]